MFVCTEQRGIMVSKGSGTWQASCVTMGSFPSLCHQMEISSSLSRLSWGCNENMLEPAQGRCWGVVDNTSRGLLNTAKSDDESHCQFPSMEMCWVGIAMVIVTIGMHSEFQHAAQVSGRPQGKRRSICTQCQCEFLVLQSFALQLWVFSSVGVVFPHMSRTLELMSQLTMRCQKEWEFWGGLSYTGRSSPSTWGWPTNDPTIILWGGPGEEMGWAKALPLGAFPNFWWSRT